MANIRIQDVPQRIQYEAAAGQTVFPIPFPFMANTDIVAYQDEDEIALGADYTLAGAGTASGGSLTLLVAATAGDIITILGAMPVDRTTIFSPTISNITGSDLNTEFNDEIIMIQQLQTHQDYLMLQYYPYSEISQDIEDTTDRFIPILPPGHVWMKNEAGTAIIAQDFSGGGGGSSDAITITVTQANHGFDEGQAVYFNPDDEEFALAIATTAATAEFVGMVGEVVDDDNFILVMAGQVELEGATPGGVYFLSDTVAGEITLTEPTTPTRVSKPLVIAISETSGVLINMRGEILADDGFTWVSINTNTQLEAGKGYLLTGGGNLQLTLPAACEQFQEIRIAGFASTGWTLLQNAGQSIQVGIRNTTGGVAGSVTSNASSDKLHLLCAIANTNFTALSSMGNLEVA